MKILCDICDIYLTSEAALKDHKAGKRHKRSLFMREKEEDKLKCQAYVTWKKELDKNQLQMFASGYGPVNNVFIHTDRRYGIVEFQLTESCSSFLCNDRYRLLDNTEIHVKPRQPSKAHENHGAKHSQKRPPIYLTTPQNSAIEPAASLSFPSNDNVPSNTMEPQPSETIVSNYEKLTDAEMLGGRQLKKRKYSNEKAERQEVQQTEEQPKQEERNKHQLFLSISNTSTDTILSTDNQQQDHNQSQFQDCDHHHQQNETHHIKKLTEKHPEVNVNFQQIEEKIDEQLRRLVKNEQLTANDLTERQNVADHIRNSLVPVFGYKNVEVHLFGSSANGVGVRGCDLDLTLLVNANLETEVILKKARNRLSYLRPQRFTNLLLIPSKRCPIIRFNCEQTGLKCDLSVNNRMALRNTEVLRCIGETVAPFRTLCIAIRKWATSVDVGGNVSGGQKFTHYSLYMLVWFYLQSKLKLPSFKELSTLQDEKEYIDQWDCTFPFHMPHIFEAKSPFQFSLTQLLLGFFDFYKDVEFKDRILSIRTGKIIPVDEFDNVEQFRKSPLMVQDPFLLEHNVTQNVNVVILEGFQSSLKEAAATCASSAFWSPPCLRTPDEVTPNETVCCQEKKDRLWGLSLLLQQHSSMVKSRTTK